MNKKKTTKVKKSEDLGPKEFTRRVKKDNAKRVETDVQVKVGHSPFDARPEFGELEVQEKSESMKMVHAPSIKPRYWEPDMDIIDTQMRAATIYINSGLLPKSITRPEQVIVILNLARALDVPYVHAFNSMYVVNGRPAMQADLMRALIFRSYPSATFDVVRSNAEECVVLAGRPGQKAQEFSFTMVEAKQAGLTGKDVWRNYPKAMLFARATSVAARAKFADVLMGVIYTPEELGAVVNEEGEVIEGAIPERETSEPKGHFMKDAEDKLSDPAAKEPYTPYPYRPNDNNVQAYTLAQHELICKLIMSHLMPTDTKAKTVAELESGALTAEKASKIASHLTTVMRAMNKIEEMLFTILEMPKIMARYTIISVKDWPKNRLSGIVKAEKFDDVDLDDINLIVTAFKAKTEGK